MAVAMGQTVEKPQGLFGNFSLDTQTVLWVCDPQNSLSILGTFRGKIFLPAAFPLFVRLWGSRTSRGCGREGCLDKHWFLKTEVCQCIAVLSPDIGF